MSAKRTQVTPSIFCEYPCGRSARQSRKRWALDTADGLELERGHEATERSARRWAQAKADLLGWSLYLWPLGEPGARGIDIEPKRAGR